ncbi:MAG: single-stranded DNA-binding protein [Peptococcaceae bacterium]|jgi:single-strand DNA-binding protein|nr:single-stranded DNA-binding protein [Peptococcaceae bacterium]MDR2736005.1 single-stranded DNA-binding protein [Gracilibacteraceae bacterium]
MLNRIVLIGRLTKDPELKYSQAGVAVANFTLAVDRSYKNSKGEKETDFIQCVVFRQLAELCSNYLSKGKLAAIDGSLQIRSFEGQDGQRRWVTEVVGDNVRFLSPKDSGSAPSSYSSSSGSSDDVPFMDEISLDDDVPF